MLFQDWGAFYPELLRGLGVSLQITAIALVVGLPLGLLAAIGIQLGPAPVRAALLTVVEVGRATPALVVLDLVYFGLPSAGWKLDAYPAAAIALAITAAAYSCEILRGGMNSVPAGETEAASALALSRLDTMRYVIVPQGLRVALPPLMGLAILIFQGTSLAYTIAVPELLSQAYSIGSTTFRYLSVLSLAGLFYAAVAIPAGLAVERLTLRLSRHI
ncbi:amino acid ABC transporter permease [Amycolatopsis jejuensis]|uniref:amino acid ABC transporter permease n=1 Tax=Amycolatopsis jejuensis TaxID=330084 RepID=UPI0005275616|nr:amino acid ABC transporter permease [Amycolatopsis jejuensis]